MVAQFAFTFDFLSIQYVHERDSPHCTFTPVLYAQYKMIDNISLTYSTYLRAHTRKEQRAVYVYLSTDYRVHQAIIKAT